MPRYKVQFSPIYKAITVEAGSTLLEAATKARITIDSVCGGDGICGRCKMIVKEGKVGGHVSALLTREEIRQGLVLACQTTVESDLLVEIPKETRAKEKIVIDEDAQRFRAVRSGVRKPEFAKAPLVSRVLLRLDPPTLDNNFADCQRVQRLVEKETGISSMQTGLKIIRRMPQVLRENDFTITVTIGRRRGVAEIMELEGGDTSARNFRNDSLYSLINMLLAFLSNTNLMTSKDNLYLARSLFSSVLVRLNCRFKIPRTKKTK